VTPDEVVVLRSAVTTVEAADRALTELGVALENTTSERQRARIVAVAAEMSKLRDALAGTGRAGAPKLTVDNADELIRSVDQADAALNLLGASLAAATGDDQRRGIAELIAEVKRLKSEMEGAGQGASVLGVRITREMTEAAQATMGLLSSLSGYLSQTYRSNVEAETAALEASGMAREDARIKAEENNEALRVNQKRLASAGVVFSTAAAIMRAFADLGPIAGGAAALGIGITGLAQLDAINREQPAGAGGGRSRSGGSSRSASIGTSSAAVGVAVGSGTGAAPAAAAPNLVVNERDTHVTLLADDQKLYAIVERGRRSVARGRGNTSGL
jgi:hypothetical protein